MLSGVGKELLAFCVPWLERDPRLLLACQFAVPGGDRGRFLAVAVLQRELAQAAIGVSDRRVAEAKLTWWLDEAAAWAQGHPRHPLAHGLDAAVDAQALARLAAVAADWLQAPSPDDFSSLWTRMRQCAAATLILSGGSDAEAWTLAWLALSMRLSVDARAALAGVLPLDLLARHHLRRSQWPELKPDQRWRLLADLAAQVPEPGCNGSDPAVAALAALERRWLRGLPQPGSERIGLGDAFAAWRAGRRASRVGAGQQLQDKSGQQR